MIKKLLIAVMLMVPLPAQAQYYEQSNMPLDTAAISDIPDQASTLALQTSNKKAGPRPLLMLADAIGYKLIFFKNIYIPAGTDTAYISRGEIYNGPNSPNGSNIPNGPQALRYRALKIKLVHPAGAEGKTIDNKTVWTITRINHNLVIVNDPSIEYLELGPPHNHYLIDLFTTLGNAIQMQTPQGEPVSYQTFSPVQSGAIYPPRCEVSMGDVYLHDFPKDFAEEFTTELSLVNQRTGGRSVIGHQHAMKKFPYANWHDWVMGILSTFFEVWEIQRSEQVPGKPVKLGTNYIFTNRQMPWKKTDTEYESLSSAPWPLGKLEAEVTVTDEGIVTASLIDSQFSEGASQVLLRSLNNLSHHPSVIFPNVFPDKIFTDERNLAIHEQKLYMGVPELPSYKTVTFRATFRCSQITK